MTLSGVIALILLYFTEFDSFAGLTSQWLKIDLYCLQNIIFHVWPQLTHSAARSLCYSSATCTGRWRPKSLITGIKTQLTKPKLTHQ